MRARRFYRESHQIAFIVARGALREILSAYLAYPAKELVFAAHDKGRPYLVQPAGKLDFNLSHSGDRAVYAVSDCPKVGVDIELIKVHRDLASLAQRCMTEREYHVWSCLHGKKRQQTFYRMWTCKEAVLKSLGEGLYRSPRSIEVDLDLQQPATLLCIQNGAVEAVWRVWTPFVHAEYATAVVMPRDDVRLNIQGEWPSGECARRILI